MGNHIGQAIRRARDRRGVYAYQLAQRIHVTPSTLSRMECGQVAVTDETLCAIARALGAKELLMRRCDTCPVGQELVAMTAPRKAA